MKKFSYLALFCAVCLIAGCGSEPTNQTVTGDADMDAIKAYEASISALESSQATMDIEGKEDAAPVDDSAAGKVQPAE